MSALRTTILVLATTALAACGNVQPNTTTPTDSDRTKGAADAPIQLVEYADFQCPACAMYSSVVTTVVAQNEGKVRLAFRHFPLESIHPNALLAAEAAEAAGDQGKFWEMHDLLFANQAEWSKVPDPTDLFVGYATTAGADPEAVRTALTKRTYRPAMRASASRAMAAGINATPTFFLNGEQIAIPRSAAELQAIIDAKLAVLAPSAPMLQSSAPAAAPSIAQ